MDTLLPDYTTFRTSPELKDERAHEVYGDFPTRSSDVYSYGCVFLEVRYKTLNIQKDG